VSHNTWLGRTPAQPHQPQPDKLQTGRQWGVAPIGGQTQPTRTGPPSSYRPQVSAPVRTPDRTAPVTGHSPGRTGDTDRRDQGSPSSGGVNVLRPDHDRTSPGAGPGHSTGPSQRDGNHSSWQPGSRDGDRSRGPDSRGHDGRSWSPDRRDHDRRGWSSDRHDRDRWQGHNQWRPSRFEWRYQPSHPYRYHRSSFWDFRLFLGLFQTDDCRLYRSSQLSEDALMDAEIWAADGTFLGVIAPPYDVYESIANPDGPHGDRWSPRSIWNHESPYGSYYSSLSAWDPDTWTPPRLYRGKYFIGYLTVNTDLSPRVGPMWLARWLMPGDYRDYD